MASNKLVDFLRSLKLTYTTYNFLHGSQLEHNKAPYKNVGLRKQLFQSISSKDFKGLPIGNIPWMDKDVTVDEIKRKLEQTNFSEEVKQAILSWKENGYIILKNFFSTEAVDSISAELETLLDKKEIDFTLGNKVMFANKKSQLIQNITVQKNLTDILEFILGTKVTPFQTINFITGSEQSAHSDSIHMTTYPLGYLIACWIALENVNENNGP